MNKLMIVASLLALSTSPVLAHDGMHGPEAVFDKDGNGSLSLEEFTAFLKASGGDVSKAAERFKSVDSNADGKLSSGEMARARKKGAT